MYKNFKCKVLFPIFASISFVCSLSDVHVMCGRRIIGPTALTKHTFYQRSGISSLIFISFYE